MSRPRLLTGLLLALLLGAPGRTQEGGADPRASLTDSAAAAFRAAAARLTSPEFEARKARRLELQRAGYAAMLHRTLAADGIGAVLALFRTKAQLDYSLPSNTLFARIPVESAPPSPAMPGLYAPATSPDLRIPLLEDRRFPRNPWSK